MDRKVAILYAFLFLLFFILFLRAAYLQTIHSDQLTRDALALETMRQIKPDRGMIYDADQRKLVTNISKSDIYLDTETLEGASDSAKQRERLETIAQKDLEMSPQDIQQRLEKKGHVLIKGNVDRSVAIRIRDTDIPGVSIEDFESRSYPYNNMASLVLGFTGKDGVGRYGIERYYDDLLSGSADAKAMAATSSDYANAGHAGASLKLTLSESLQRKTEDILETHREKNHAKRVTAIVQETQTGAVVSMASTDDYNLNNPYGPANKEQRAVWSDLTEEQKSDIWFDNWRNFSVSDTYEPGSTFKTITAAAALEENTTNPKKHYYCTGYIRDIPGITITCTSLPNPHGDITMDDAFAQSCNVSFVNIARELSKEGMLKYIRAFGFGEKTGIDLPAEQKGLVPKDVGDINDARLATMSYGHGISVTPIQMVTAVSAVANGGYLVEPYVVDEIKDADGKMIKKHKTTVKRQVISNSTSETMRTLLTHVVERGTGTLGAVDHYAIGGKTGTAGKVSESGGYEKDKYISSFVSVGPVDDPKYTVLVIVEEPEGDYFGGTVAAPIASEIMGEALREAGIPESTTVGKKKTKKIIVPDVENMLLEDAGKALTDVGLRFNMASENVGDFGIVKEQRPKAGTEVDDDAIIDLKIDPNDKDAQSVPNFLGKSKQEVASILENSGIRYEMEGEGTVVSQEPLAGKKLEKGQKLLLRFEKAPVDGASDGGDDGETRNESSTSSRTEDTSGENGETAKNASNDGAENQ
ncbi:MAG: penicillin-binding transpeptidase domain-containing protein [Peptoniphilus sp.]|nr:penicillin-binding transpeptidase domain-containing protein [Peptoniphilus sp.]MDD7363131.1 penicillin-binding transpeptidase domain-containing protein [Bacillota bacterium]MDY6044347.1 penicillin-binding transpeptidase domain-containing protein [Peptoniphilus sp.]